jgi:hypothetical protein
MDKPGVEGGSAEAGEVELSDRLRDCETVSDASPSSRVAEQMKQMKQMSRRADEQMSRCESERERDRERSPPSFHLQYSTVVDYTGLRALLLTVLCE